MSVPKEEHNPKPVTPVSAHSLTALVHTYKYDIIIPISMI
jgi:hypothetical protein